MKTDLLVQINKAFLFTVIWLLLFLCPAAIAQVLIDNTDSNFSTVGYWNTSSTVEGYYGTDYRIASAGTGSKTATWHYTVTQAGQYDIYAQWCGWDGRAPDAPFTIYNNGVALTTVIVDQRGTGGVFNYLATCTLATGSLDITVTDDASAKVVADAVMIDPVPMTDPVELYVGFGDSITRGTADDISSDGTGYEPILASLLSIEYGYSIIVANEGVSGNTSLDGLNRIQAVLDNYPSAQYIIVQFGTNDAFTPVESGLGLTSGDDGYEGSFKDNIQQIITAILDAGKTPLLAKVPIAFSPYTYLNVSLIEYNAVLDELKEIAGNNIFITPPNFYAFFSNNPGYIYDGLHPDGLGYQSMAAIWFNSLK